MKDRGLYCYEGDYSQAAFYSKMGRFFAEERYIRQMPYLRNKPEKVWFTVEIDGVVVAFSSIEFPNAHILFTTEYVEPEYRRRGLFKILTKVRFDYCRDLDLPIRTSTDLSFIKDYYVRQGFEVYRATRNYWFLSRPEGCLAPPPPLPGVSGKDQTAPQEGFRTIEHGSQPRSRF